MASPETINLVTRLMATLNKDAATVMKNYPVHACTDITGFGLLGHLAEMVIDSNSGIQLMADQVPIMPEALEYARMGLFPVGAYKNREFRESMVRFSPAVDLLVQDILFDPQTSGGLLMAVGREKADELIEELKAKGIDQAAVIGEVAAEPAATILVF